MNIENAFANTNEVENIISIANRRLNGDLQELKLSAKLNEADSYEEFLHNNEKRKIAISHVKNGWITIIESKEVNDYAMLLEISKAVKCKVLAVVQYDCVGAWGYVIINNGIIIENYFSKDDEDYERLIKEKMDKMGIDKSLVLFKEIVKDDNYIVLRKTSELKENLEE